MKLLILDDDPQFRELFEQTVKRVLTNNTSVTHAADVPAAKAALEAGSYDLVCLDLSLPQGDGREVLRWIRARDPRQPVLILSGRDTLSQGELGPYTRFAEKPMSLIGLGELITVHAARALALANLP